MDNEHSTQATNRSDLVVTYVFDASVEHVWKAWSEPEYVRQWWGPEGFTAPYVRMDFREGGTSLVCMRSPAYGDQYCTWQYEKIVPMQQIEYIHNLSDKDGHAVDPVLLGMPTEFPQNQRHTVTFKDLGDGKTETTVIEHEWGVGQMMEMSRLGLVQCLEKMARSLNNKE
jgi:uncharacterized protein YndB with AHSA1/START domain